ncbi:cell division protein FtsK [Corallococcus exiguus]|uniref:MXAN_5187 family protein n=1 Tax=Corallococcus TaxID=83461 RepID=UPI000EC5DF91|nr:MULTISPECIES: MXAN_5187 family protein [Corallococcus]NRD65516.1 cell division protein FtsK [Corallococcus exiguus]RKI19213.1 cell division protein FtsK [Corallococcus sp. AB030]
MVRLKFLLFALLVLGLGLAHLPTLSAPQRARAVEGASLQAASGTGEVARRVDARRAEAQSLALKLAGSPQMAAAVRALSPAPAPKSPRDRYGSKDAEETAGLLPLTAERFGALRTAAEAGLPQELQGAVVAVVAGDAVFHARAGAEPSSDTAALDVAALARAGTSVVDAFGAPHVFASVPLVWSGEGTPAPAVTLVVGVPLAADAALQGALDASGAAAVGLVQGGDKVVGGVGAEKARLEGSLPRLTVGAKDTVLESGSLQALGPVQLPAFTNGDAMGGQAPLFVGSRQALTGTPYEVVVLAGTAATLAPLAAYQHTALLALAGLFVLSLVWTALMGGSKKDSGEETVSGGSDTLGWGAAMAAQQSAPAAQPVANTSPPAPAAVAPVAAAPADPFGSSAHAEPPSNPFGSAAHAEPLSNPFASVAPPAAAPADPFGDAFPFPGTPAPAADPFAMPPPAAAPFAMPPPAAAPLADPFAGVESFPFPSPPSAYPPPAAEQFAPPPAYAHGGAMPFEQPVPSAEPIAPAAPRHAAFAFEDQPTAAYSLQQAANPFALAAAQSSDPESPETTRVAAIPRELLQASTRPTSEAIPMPAPRSNAVPLPMPGVNGAAAAALSEEQHFQDVFREFVTTRERCGEQADGLTYDKFVQKLRKNKEQLVTKYACKTVRFQVYVKEGKAALKATPVKD